MCAQIISVQFGEFSQAGHPGNQHQNRSKTKHFGLPEGPSVTLSATTHVLRVLRAESYLPGRIRTEVDGITVLCAAPFAQDHGLGIRLWRRVEPHRSFSGLHRLLRGHHSLARGAMLQLMGIYIVSGLEMA